MMCCFETLANQYGPGEEPVTLVSILARWPTPVDMGDARLLQALLPVVLALQIAKGLASDPHASSAQREAAANEACLWVTAVSAALGG